MLINIRNNLILEEIMSKYLTIVDTTSPNSGYEVCYSTPKPLSVASQTRRTLCDILLGEMKT